LETPDGECTPDPLVLLRTSKEKAGEDRESRSHDANA
jgi:hypothetical protein